MPLLEKAVEFEKKKSIVGKRESAYNQCVKIIRLIFFIHNEEK